MARETVYIVQSYVAGNGNRLKADTPFPCKSAEIARRKAERREDSLPDSRRLWVRG
jgi:hypothetical protein